jgi:predicted NAD-dependent protein-ADP-ribosyltransferase YbiA (DUF1768 family)
MKAKRLTLDTDAEVFFYEQEFYVLSNFSAFNLKWRGLIFPTSEHAYHWEKLSSCSCLSPHILDKVQNAPSAH